MRSEAGVTVVGKAARDSDLFFLLALAWYMIVLIQQDRAAGAEGA